MAKSTLVNTIVNVGDTLVISRMLKARNGSAWFITQLDICAVSEKAVCVKASTSEIKVWFPKSALIVESNMNFPRNVIAVQIARWFNVNEWYVRIEDNEGSFGAAQ